MRGLVDRLAERGWIDRWGFIGFAFGGAAIIVFAKSQSIDPVFVAMGAALSIIVYAVVVQRSGTGRLRGDQAGDNCYYLGLIFTLASLAYAIFTFNPADTATTIVQGFGVALATTIVGLVLRVFFNQTRADVVEVEDSARIELAEAAGRLKSELSQVVVSLNDFSRQTRQSLEELRDEILSTLGDVRDEATSSVKQQADDAVSRSKKLVTATDKVVTGFERSAASLSDIEASHVGLASTISSVEEAASIAHVNLQALSEQSAELRQLQQGLTTSVSDVGGITSRVLEQVAALDDAASKLDARLSARIDQVKSVPTDIVSNAVTGVETAIGRLETTLQNFNTRQEEASERAVAVAERHNQALEAELEKSRQNVAKVHAALVEMTGQLADRLEGKA